MSTKQPDDFDAVRIIVDALTPFDAKDQERIIRWAREKIGLVGQPHRQSDVTHVPASGGVHLSSGSANSEILRSRDIKSFVDLKKPQSDVQFAAAVAYYYRFDATETEQKPDITADDLQHAARQTGRTRFTRPAQTLVNAHSQGYFDKAGRGRYALNAVGENLVAMALPQSDAISPQRASNRKRKRTTKPNKRTAQKKK